jgi:hypothetical protein
LDLKLLAGAAVALLVILGITRWRKRRDTAVAEQAALTISRLKATRSTGQPSSCGVTGDGGAVDEVPACALA